MSCAALETYDREGMTALMWAVRRRLPRTVAALCERAYRPPPGIDGGLVLDIKGRERLRSWADSSRTRPAALPAAGRSALEMAVSTAADDIARRSCHAPLGGLCLDSLKTAMREHDRLYREPAAAIVLETWRNANPLIPREIAALVFSYSDLTPPAPPRSLPQAPTPASSADSGTPLACVTGRKRKLASHPPVRSQPPRAAKRAK
jgi:hypothetical protein